MLALAGVFFTIAASRVLSLKLTANTLVTLMNAPPTTFQQEILFSEAIH